MAGPWEKYQSAPAAGPWTQYAAKAEPEPMTADPTGTTGQNIAAGAGKFVADTASGASKLSADMLADAPNSLPLLKAIGMALEAGGMSPRKTANEMGERIKETRKLDKPLMDTGGGKAGYIGAGLTTAPLMGPVKTVKGASAASAALAAVQPALDWAERGVNSGVAALTGGLGQFGVNKLASAISPKISPQVRSLMNEGVTPTPGQILGGGFRRAEEGLTSVPILGDSVKAGQRRAVADFGRAAFERALKPVGEKLPKGLEGREAVEHVGEVLSRKYQDLLPKMTTQADDAWGQQIASLRNLVKEGNLGEAEAGQFEKILQSKVLSKFQGQNAVTGETLKGIESDLNRLASGYRRDPSFDKQQLGDALLEVQSALRDLISRSNPQYAKELSAANTGWANFKRVQRAASSVAAENGVFSPAQLLGAVKALDRSKDKARFAEGKALMQDLAESGKTVLSSKVPDSGTPYRALLAAGGAGAVGGPAALTAALTGPVMYSKAGQNALATLLARRPDSAPAVANMLRELAAPASLAASPGLAYVMRE